MSRHSFEPEIAEKVGINAAVIYQNIVWWCEKNAANERNIHDGRAWTYNSLAAFETLFPYLTGKQIRLALEKLKDSGFIVTGCFNKDPRDRTIWYAPAGNMHLPKRAERSAQKGRPLPDSKPVDKQTPIAPVGGEYVASDQFDLLSECPTVEPGEDVDVLFDEWWGTIWPKHHRKAGKADCRDLYRKIVTGKYRKADQIAARTLNDATRRYIASVRDPQYIKAPLPWLRGCNWEPFVGGGRGPDGTRRTPYAERQRAILSGEAIQ